MRYFPQVLTAGQSDALAGRIRQRMAEDGFGFWAVEVPGRAPFIGFTGLSRPRFTAHFTPCVEIGWRLAFAHWGQGYASEAAAAALHHAFAILGLDEVVALTVPANTRSQAVMRRIGMAGDPADDFDHPDLPDGHALRRHVLYRIRRTARLDAGAALWQDAGHAGQWRSSSS